MVMKCFKYNQHFVAMMNIINAARLNPPESGHKHHIVPKCWFKMNNLPIDNSKENLVLLTYEDHVKVHKLACLCADTKEMASKMGFAVKRLLKGTFCGMHHTENTRKRISEAKKGYVYSEERNKKISESLKCHSVSEDTCRKISESKKGHTVSVDARKKISEAHKGMISPRKGVTLSEETRKRISESLKRRKNKGTLGLHWYNNGSVNTCAYECPEGFVKGMLNHGK